jgi:ferric-dicitrate binding protein FerR (iron transport regulator)
MGKDKLWSLIGKKLAGEASDAELQELEELLRRDPEMYYALQHIYDLWNLPARDHDEEADAFHRHLARMQQAGVPWEQPGDEYAASGLRSRSSHSRKRIWMVALAATLLLAAGVYTYYSQPHKIAATGGALTARGAAVKKEFSTHNGYRQKITLPDGSTVWLNAGSKLSYNSNSFGSPAREVELSGEAFFDVVTLTRSALNGATKIPFIIHTPQIDVRVLGTAFNVKSYPGDRQTETSLVRGKVEVIIHNRSNEKIILRPNEKLVVVNDEAAQPAANTPANAKNQPIVSLSKLSYTGADSIVAETAWVQNKLVFDNESFLEVAAKMERWYNVQFEFINKQQQQLRFTGVFENETLQQALDYMAITAPFHYTIAAGKVTIER